ncbi:MAG: hypothetical protein HQM08_23550 [Candidatus Riflebacteria bacterium]|nr:hypothetical protein [Candidatus Riflebacteria bacterium]
MKDQYRGLCQKLRGHFQYYGIRGNEREHDILWKFDQNKLGRKALKTKASD